MRFCLMLLLLLSAAPAVLFGPATHAASPANDPFEQTWSRTDLPVAAGQVNRTWMWGPEATHRRLS